ncbi:hypothetical protein MJD09_02945, partial [bacterium]|nr:hypothetical protein [bacterium]
MSRFEWRKMPVRALLRSPLGRFHLRHLLLEKYWRLLQRAIICYRKRVIQDTRLVAVVGSVGKSTTTRAVTAALDSILRQPFHHNYRIFLARALLSIRPGQRYVVLEVGIRGKKEMQQNAELVRPDIVVVTAIGNDHHLSFGNLKVTRKEKSRMVRALSSSGLAILNGDDPNVLWMAGKTAARVVTFGKNPGNDVRASEITLDWPNGTNFKLHANGQTRSLRVRLCGEHMVYPILAAVAVALAEGCELDIVVQRLESLKSAPGRLETIRLENGAIVLRDDIKASQDSLNSALDLFAAIPVRRKIIVMGALEEISGSVHQKYRSVGKRIGEVVSQAIFVVDTSNKYRAYSVGAASAGVPKQQLSHARNAGDGVFERLAKTVGPGDAVLIKASLKQRLERVVLALEG